MPPSKTEKDGTVSFTASIQKFGEMGEKTGWTYLPIPPDIAGILYPDNKKSFRVKGWLDHFAIEKIALMPMGDGSFILPLNTTIRKAIGKNQGAMVEAILERDNEPKALNKDLLTCLTDDPSAEAYFISLPRGHQTYFSNWIDAAKTEETRTRRLLMAVNALSRGLGYGEMIRESKAKRGI